MHAVQKLILAAIASGATVYAQTSSSCNPTLKSGCPVDPALSKAVEYDFTQGAPDDFTVSTGSAPDFTSAGAVFTIAKKGDAPTLISKWYMMFGHYEIKAKAAPGQGVISSIVLLSDDLDEIDWEWVGSDSEHVQTNYYGQGKTTSYTRGQTLADPGSQSDFHTYTLDWTADAITWAIDGKTVRTLTPQTAETGQYPQSPMQLKIGPWVGGDVGQPQGTTEWAGGLIDWSKAPYQMVVTSVKAIDYSTGKSYSYGDQTGTWQSIKSDGGSINSKGDPNTPVSQASAAGSAVAATASGAAATAPAAIADQVANSNSTTNSTVSTGAPQPPSTTGGSGSGSGSTTLVSNSSAPFNNASATGATTPVVSATNAAGSSGTNSASASATPHNSAARIGGSIGALALAAAVMVL